jgi:hypothetical protein
MPAEALLEGSQHLGLHCLLRALALVPQPHRQLLRRTLHVLRTAAACTRGVRPALTAARWPLSLLSSVRGVQVGEGGV